MDGSSPALLGDAVVRYRREVFDFARADLVPDGTEVMPRATPPSRDPLVRFAQELVSIRAAAQQLTARALACEREVAALLARRRASQALPH